MQTSDKSSYQRSLEKNFDLTQCDQHKSLEKDTVIAQCDLKMMKNRINKSKGEHCCINFIK